MLNRRDPRSNPRYPSSSPSARSIPNQTFPTVNIVSASHDTDPAFLPGPWDDSQKRTRPRVRSMNERPSNHLTTSSDSSNLDIYPPVSFPEPDFTQPALSNLSLSIPSRGLQHRHSAHGLKSQFQISASRHESSSYQGTKGLKHDPEFRSKDREESAFSGSGFDLDDLLDRFQKGKLNNQDEEWHVLVSTEAQDALGKQEVRRQSIMFEIIKGERDYVADLELVQMLFIDGLHAARPQIIPADSLPTFILEVFGNLKEIFNLHQLLLYALFERQREQHPVLQTVADIILDRVIRDEFRTAYETYIKHYPLAESYHRKELKHNNTYEQFIQSISNDPRVRKRDLITFLSRPVTRLPRLSLLLEETLKVTEKEYEHPDLETLPLVLGILRDCIKSTQPGIEAAEGKVKFWSLCESLVYRKGEIIDMDLYEQSRTLIHSSPVTRRIRSESGFHEWDDLVASLLDNYLLLTREEKQQDSSSVKQHLISRPLYLSFLRLGSFDDAPDTRKVKSEGGLLDTLKSHSVPIFPFIVFHSSSPSTRRYTLYAVSETQRQKWKQSLSETIALHQLREDSNKWFDPQNITSSCFRIPTQFAAHPQGLGRISSAVPFTYANRKFLVVGCPAGIFVSIAGHEDFKKALVYSNPRYMAAIQETVYGVFNRLIVHIESAVVSYSLGPLAQLALGQTGSDSLDASKEDISNSESNIIFCKCMQIGSKTLVIYASKRRLGTSVTLQVMEAVDQAEIKSMTHDGKRKQTLSFRAFGEPGFVPRDAFDVVALTKHIAICTQDGIVIADPTNLARSVVTVIPDLQDTISNSPMSVLKERLKDVKPLGLVHADAHELLLIYDLIGCYITKLGVPSRSSGYITWETQANGFARRGNHILLISSQFIEIRNINTGRIAQIIEGVDIRLMYSGYATSDRDDRVLVAMRGTRKEDAIADRVVELVETVAYVSQSAVSRVPDEWDM